MLDDSDVINDVFLKIILQIRVLIINMNLFLKNRLESTQVQITDSFCKM